MENQFLRICSHAMKIENKSETIVRKSYGSHQQKNYHRSIRMLL